MSPLGVVSVTYSHAPLSTLERVAYGADEVPPRLQQLVQLPKVWEAAILSTCNRTEIYASFAGPPEPERLGWFLAADRGVPGDELRPLLTTKTDQAVVHHLFRVAAGLDSMVVGEVEIQGQVRAAYALARGAGTVGGELEDLFRRAIEVGRRVRRETALGTSGRSLGHSAVKAGAAALGGLAGRTVLVVGAGKIARAAVDRVQEEAAHLLVWNRTEERALQLAGARARVLPLGQLRQGLARADLVICCSAAPPPLVSRVDIRRTMAARNGRLLAIVDLSVPRNVDPAGKEIPGVRLIDLDDLDRERAQDGPRLTDAIRDAEQIVEDEADGVVARAASREAGALIAALRRDVEELCTQEMERVLRGRQSADREVALAALRGALAKLLHRPTILAKEAAASGDSNLIADLRRIFDLKETKTRDALGAGPPRSEKTTACSCGQKTASGPPPKPLEMPS